MPPRRVEAGDVRPALPSSVLSSQTNFSEQKACSVLGLGLRAASLYAGGCVLKLCGFCESTPVRSGPGAKYCSEECRWHADRTRRYGVSAEEYKGWLASGVCSACGKAAEGRMSVDHCHVSDRARGLVHQRCNVGIGQSGDEPDELFRWGVYLARHTFDLRDLCAA